MLGYSLDAPKRHARRRAVSAHRPGAEGRLVNGSHADVVAIQRAFESLPRDTSAHTSARNLALIRALGRRDHASALLLRIRQNPDLLRQIAGRSYRHTNHFDKIVLVDTASTLGYRLTLHLWQPPFSEAEIRDEQIHDHRFSFWSTILVGRMAFQNYVRDASGTPFNEFQYIPEKLQESTVGNFYLDVGASPLLETPSTIETVGAQYSIPFSRIHRVVLPSGGMTCTMVLRGPRQKNYASVFSSSRKYKPSANVMFTPSELAERLSMIVDAMQEPPHASAG